MTTPEQLAKWREKFERSLHKFAKNRSKCGLYEDHTVHSQWQGYLRRCQETEQAIKDARKQTLEEAIQCVNSERGGSSDNLILAIERLLK